jgi:hypothetical protein
MKHNVASSDQVHQPRLDWLPGQIGHDVSIPGSFGSPLPVDTGYPVASVDQSIHQMSTDEPR